MDTSTTSRVLRLLDLLQTRRFWSGGELAERLAVGTRTVRRDIERLRQLGYRVDGVRGVDGGYLLAPGSELPPMVFTNEEAVAIAVGLGTAASANAVAGLDVLALSAMAKIEQVLPSALRRRVSAFRTATAPSAPLGGAINPELLAQLALACRDAERVRLRYKAADGVSTSRGVEPLKLVPRARRWYLVCWDRGHEDWRTLRVDRITDVAPTGLRFSPRELPAPDAAAFVQHRFSGYQPEHVVTVRIHATLAATSAYLGGHVTGLVSEGAQTTWVLRDTRLKVLAAALVWLPWRFTVLDSPALTTVLQEIGHRFINCAPERHCGTATPPGTPTGVCDTTTV